MSSCTYTTQGILICTPTNEGINTSEKSNKEKMQTSFWNRIEQFNDSNSNADQLINTPEQTIEVPKKNKIIH